VLEPLRTVFLIVAVAITYLVFTAFISRIASWRLRSQLPSILGHRALDAITDAEARVVYIYPLHWHEQMLWPLWLPVALVMKLIGAPKPLPTTSRTERKGRS